MVNLLPVQTYKRVRWERRRRITIVALVFMSCALVMALLFALPSIIVTWFGVKGFDTQLETTKTLVDVQRKQGRGDMLSDLSERAALLEQALSVRTPTSVLEDIVPRIPEGVRIRQFTYTLSGDAVSVAVLGTADTRASLIAFGNALRQSPLFSRVDVPVSSLAKSEDIDFSLALALAAPVDVTLPPATAPIEEATTTDTETAPETISETDTREPQLSDPNAI